MGMAKHVSELVVWQLADEMRRHVFSWTERRPFVYDFKARGQIDDAVNSVCRNVSEGFPGTHKEFARYLRIARRSLNEVLDCTRAAQMKRYINASEASEVYRLARRLFPAMKEFIAYLERTPDPPSRQRHDDQRGPKHPPHPPPTDS
jgi:four helix bundle protein